MTNENNSVCEPIVRTKARDAKSRLLGHPDDVVNNPDMSVAEKRALLASWASDAHAVANAPSLRQPAHGSIIEVDEILRALKALDDSVNRERCSENSSKPWTSSFDRRRGAVLGRWSRIIRRNRRDDDDDPPPCPAYAGVPPKRWGGALFGCAEPALRAGLA